MRASDHHDRVHLVFPAREILEEIKPTADLLLVAQANPQGVVSDMLEVVFSGNRVGSQLYPDLHSAAHIPGAGRLIRSHYAVSELIESQYMDGLERTTESLADHPAVKREYTPQDVIDLRKLLHSIWTLISDELVTLIESVEMSDSEVQQLQFERWIGHDFIVSIPTRRRKK